MRAIALLSLGLVLLPAGVAGQAGRGGQMQMNQRAQLESRIMQRFVEQSSREIGLNQDERRRVEQWLQESQQRRRELALDAAQMRRRLMIAVRDPRTDDAEFTHVLNEMNALREREHQNWMRDQRELEGMLGPRKRAQLTVRLLRLQETIRELIERRDSADVPAERGVQQGPGAAAGGDPFMGPAIDRPAARGGIGVGLPARGGRRGGGPGR